MAQGYEVGPSGPDRGVGLGLAGLGQSLPGPRERPEVRVGKPGKEGGAHPVQVSRPRGLELGSPRWGYGRVKASRVVLAGGPLDPSLAHEAIDEPGEAAAAEEQLIRELAHPGAAPVGVGRAPS